GVLEARFEVEAIPETGRKYQGPSEDESPSPDVAPLVKKYEELPGGGDVTTDHALPGPEFDASAIDTEPTPAEEQNVSETSKKGRSWWPFGGTKTSS
nr:hypothetical protein [Thermogutta sp.]